MSLSTSTKVLCPMPDCGYEVFSLGVKNIATVYITWKVERAIKPYIQYFSSFLEYAVSQCTMLHNILCYTIYIPSLVHSLEHLQSQP